MNKTDFQLLLEKGVSKGVSDIHITVGTPPVFRINGMLERFGYEKLSVEDTERIKNDILTEEQIKELDNCGELDCTVSVSEKYRFRANIFTQRGSYAIALRYVNSEILSLEKLGLPGSVRLFAEKNQGIVLVTGPTGNGKSTTLAALIDIINSERKCHIITLEDPIEFLHTHKKSIVNQREMGTDSKSYKSALRATLREDPDVILIGEMRDYESIAIALTAAETGHLVFSTLHTVGAPKTIDRIIDVFPPNQQQQVKFQLSMTLEGVVSQQLIPAVDGKSRKVATEVMISTPAIRNLIREGKAHQIRNAITTSASAGMISMDDSLLKLYRARAISYDELILRCIDPDYIKQNMSSY